MTVGDEPEARILDRRSPSNGPWRSRFGRTHSTKTRTAPIGRPLTENRDRATSFVTTVFALRNGELGGRRTTLHLAFDEADDRKEWTTDAGTRGRERPSVRVVFDILEEMSETPGGMRGAMGGEIHGGVRGLIGVSSGVHEAADFAAPRVPGRPPYREERRDVVFDQTGYSPQILASACVASSTRCCRSAPATDRISSSFRMAGFQGLM